MRWLYSALLYAMIPLLLLRLLWRSRRAPAYRQRWAERFGYVGQLPVTAPIWLHAVSVGEAQAAQPLIRQLQVRYPDWPILVTTTTPTGAARVEALFGDEVIHRYMPFDLPCAIGRLLQRVQPRILIVMETEIWPNLLAASARQGIPTLLANARLSERSAKGYRRLAGLTAEALGKLSQIAAQGGDDAERFLQLGADPNRLQVTGSIKFDINLPASLREQAEALRRSWGMDRQVWVAASTHEGEESQVLAAHRQIKQAVPNALLVLVPRHPERFGRVAGLIDGQGFRLVKRSEDRACEADTDVFLADSMGELPMFLAASDLAFIGGSLVPHGGHNMLEAAAQGVPVLFGPHMFNFAEISRMCLEQQAALEVGSADELAAVASDWLLDAEKRSLFGENGLELVNRNRGALERLMELVDDLVRSRNEAVN